jgi:hypothetical protein
LILPDALGLNDSSTPPAPPTLLPEVMPAFTAPEVYDDFDRYRKLY